MENLDVHSLKEWLDNGEPVLLLDVREDWEFTHCNIQGSLNIPLSAFQDSVNELQADKNIVLICHHGARSFSAGMFLQNSGVKARLYNLEGGIDAWAEHIDNSIPRY